MSLNTKWLFCTSVFLLLLLSAKQTADAYFLTEDGVEEWRGQRADETIPNQNAACDSTMNLTGSGGHLVSYNFPNNYANNLFCTWYIKADPLPNALDNSVIRIRYQSFRLETEPRCAYDYIAFYSGTAESADQLLRKDCGAHKPGPLTIDGLHAFGVFKTDDSNTYSGFHATWEVLDGDIIAVPNQNQACTNAPLMLSGTHGSVVSWNYPNNYANNLRCAWKITATENPNFNTTGIKLTVEDFFLEINEDCSRFDYLKISSGPNTELIEIGKYCGLTIPDTIIGYNRQMSLEFVTDSSKAYRGFHLLWTTVEIGEMLIQHEACLNGSRPLLLKGKEGEILSWNYPGHYLPNINCAWQIMADTTSEQSVVKLTVVAIDIAESKKCTTDNVTIYDSSSYSSTLIGHFCGSTKPSPVFSTGTDMFVTFKSVPTVSNTNTGFRLLWSISEPSAVVNHSEACTDGPLMLAGNDGEFFSWNYPGNYANFLHCSWEITGVDVDKVIQLTFVDFLTETPCTTDYLTLYNRDETNDNWEEYKKLCGERQDTKVAGSSNRMLVTFDTDFTVVNRGFHIKWEMVDWSFFIPNQNHACSSTQTPLELTGHEGHIVSYNYPDNYANNLNCSWKIAATVLNTTFEKTAIELTFRDFLLETVGDCRFDNLTVFDGPSPLSPKLGTYCGMSAPKKMLIHGTDAYLQFWSDVSSNFRGFHITWKTIDAAHIASQNIACTNGGLVQNGTSGEIMSWNFPGVYDSNLQCSWKIVAGTNNVESAVKLTFQSFDIERDDNCLKDSLAIYDGDTSSPDSQPELLARLCGFAIPSPVVSSGNKMDLTFTTGSHLGNVHSGFHITWNISEPEEFL